jgi:hypothetical protein
MGCRDRAGGAIPPAHRPRLPPGRGGSPRLSPRRDLAPIPQPRGVVVELASRTMRSTTPSDTRRSILRLAVAGIIVGLAIPLLPLFGEGGRLDFIFSQGLPWRLLILYLLRWWVSALVAVVGIWFLKRDQAAPAGGVFLAVGLVVAIGVAGEVFVTAPHFGRWQYDMVLGLETAEAILLTLAGLRAIAVVSEVQTAGSPPPESQALIDD